MRKERKHYTAEEKVAILRRHLLDKVPVSDLCEELGLQPTVFYRWQKEFFENGAAAFQGKSRPDHQGEQQRIEFLQKKIHAARDRKLEQARTQRQLRRAAESLAHFSNTTTMTSPGETEAGSAGMQPC